MIDPPVGCSERGRRLSFALSIDHAVKNVCHDFVRMDDERVVAVLELESAVSALFSGADGNFVGVDFKCAVALLPTGEMISTGRTFVFCQWRQSQACRH